MPTYDYQCRSCGTVTEVIHPMAENGPTTCELCGGDLRRVLYPTGIIFKGSGFYRNDSRSGRDGSGSGSASSSGASPGKSGSDSSGTESTAKTDGTPKPTTGGTSGSDSGTKSSSSGEP